MAQARKNCGNDGARMPRPTPRLRIVLYSFEGRIWNPLGSPHGRSSPTHLGAHTGGREDRVHSIALGRIQQEYILYDDEYSRDI